MATIDQTVPLISQIYESIGLTGGVERVMSVVGARLGSPAAFWYVLRPNDSYASVDNPFLFNGFSGFQLDNIKTFNDEMWRYDYALKHAATTDRTTETHELISAQDAARSDYVAWLTRVEGIDRRIARSTAFTNGTVAGWSFHLPVGLKRTSMERRLFDALAPHLGQMFRLTSLLGDASVRSDTLEQAMERRSQAVVLLDHDGGICWTNEAARSLSADADGLCCTASRIGFHRPADRRDFDLMLARAGRPDARGIADTMGEMIVERRSGKRPCIVRLAPAPTTLSQHMHSRSAFIVTVDDPERIVGGQPGLWRSLFGLTPTEARVAMGSMRGLPDASIAATLGIGIGTVRTHQRNILAKTETRSKAELAHLLTRLG